MFNLEGKIGKISKSGNVGKISLGGLISYTLHALPSSTVLKPEHSCWSKQKSTLTLFGGQTILDFYHTNMRQQYHASNVKIHCKKNLQYSWIFCDQSFQGMGLGT